MCGDSYRIQNRVSGDRTRGGEGGKADEVSLSRPSRVLWGCFACGRSPTLRSMSDQQPTPEAPREDPGSVTPAPMAAGGPAAPPPGGPAQPPVPQPPAPSAPAAPAPPVWPAHAAEGDPAAGQTAAYPPAAPAPGYGYPPPGYPPQGYAYPPPGYVPAVTTSTSAIVGLVLAIASWVVCPIVLAIVALVLAKKSGDEIAASGGRVGGEGLNTATKVVAWINIGLYAAVVVIFGAIFLIALVLGAASGTTS